MGGKKNKKLNRRIGQNHPNPAPAPQNLAPPAPVPAPAPAPPAPIPGVQGLRCTLCAFVAYGPGQMIHHVRVFHIDVLISDRHIAVLCCRHCMRIYARDERDGHQARCLGYR